MQAELKFEQTRIEALNVEIARLKRWRFGSSSESLDTTTQEVLFDRILADTALEDRAAEQEIKQQPAASTQPKRKAIRQALPAEPAAHRASPRDRPDALRVRPTLQAHRRRGQRATRLRAGPILRAAPCSRQVRLCVLPDDQGRADARTDHRQGHCGPGPAGPGGGGQAR